MPYARLDDRFHSDPKIHAAGRAATGVFSMLISWCSQELSDGFVPISVLGLYSTPRLTSRLVEAGLCSRCEGGIVLTKYLEHNDSRQEVLLRKQKAADKKRRQRGTRSDVSPGDEPGDSRDVSPGDSPDTSPLLSSSRGSSNVVEDLEPQLANDPEEVR